MTLKVGVLLSSREQFSPFYGGALARWTYEVYSRLSDRVEATVFGFPTAPEHLYNMPHRTSGVWRACYLISTIPVLRRWDEPLWLRGLIRSLRHFDVVHIHNRPQWVPGLRRLGYDGTIWLHLQNNHLGHWTAAMLDALAPQLDGVAVCSVFLRGTFAGRSPSLAAKTKVIFNGVNTQMFIPREDTREAKTIFFVGRLDEEKGILQLVRAYAYVLDRHPDATLVIGGTTGFGVHRETDYVRKVRKLAESLTRNRNARIYFPGYIHHDKDLPAWFQRATVFASPSLFEEPFGLVNAEAMACGTPVVGSNRGGIPEVLGDAGILVNPEEVEQFAGALSSLLEDPDYRASLGRAAYLRSREMFDWEIIAQRWAAILEEVGGESASARNVAIDQRNLMSRKTVILTEIIAPYRIPVFNALARRKEIDLHVIFLAETDKGLRQWRIDTDEIDFSFQVLPCWRGRAGKSNLLMNRGLWSALNAAKPQSILCGGYNYPAFWEALWWARRRDVRFVLWTESNEMDKRSGLAVVEWLKRHFVRSCSAFVVPGTASAFYLRTLGVSERVIFTAPNAVDNIFFGTQAETTRLHAIEFREKLKLPLRFILFVGRLVPEKGVFDLLQAYAKLESGLRSEVGLVFAGDGICREELVRRAQRVTPGTVCFPGFAQREELAGLYALGEVLVLPTHSDPWGLVVNEAMACGVPVIVSSVAGCSADLVEDGWNGYVVPPRDSEKLSAALTSLLQQPEIKQQMSARSLERIRNYSPEACAEGLVAAAVSANAGGR